MRSAIRYVGLDVHEERIVKTGASCFMAIESRTALSGVILLSWLLDTGAVAAQDDEWPRYAHDGALTGRTSLKGDITIPRVAWTISVAGTALEVEVRPAAERGVVRLPPETPVKRAQRTVEIRGAAMRDLDGTGSPRPAVESYHERWARFVPGVQGLQRTRWDNTWTTAKICHLELYAYDRGYDKPRRLWRSEPEGTVFMPLCVVYDIDADGIQEICVALHYRVMIYEGTTGRKECELKFHSSRSYGWFGIADVDADDQMELVVLSDFQSHLDVLDFDVTQPEESRLSVLWRRDIEQRIEDRKKWPQIGPRPLADVTGDGTPEIVINLFGDTGDDEWHTVVLEAKTGRVLVDLPSRYTHGNADVDGDGAAEIFCTATRGVFVPDFGRIEIVGGRYGATSVEWSGEGAGFGLANLPGLGPTWSTGASMGMRHVLLTDESSRPAFLVLSREASSESRGTDSTSDRLTKLTAMRHGPTGFRALWEVDGFTGGLETLAVKSEGGEVSALLRARMPAGSRATLTAADAVAVVVDSKPLGTAPFSPVAARLAPDDPVHVLVEGAADNVFAIRPPPRDSARAVTLWQRPGRGMGEGTGREGVIAVDLDGDQRSEVVAADQTGSGAAALVAYRAGGGTYWRRVFERTPGARPVHNVGALTYWWPGNFRSKESLDLFVNTRRGPMHSDVGHLLDGRSGRTVWSQTKAIAPGKFNWGYAGVPLAACDLQADGVSELVNLYPVCFWIADGRTGEIVSAADLASRTVLPAWAAYGEPIVHDFTRDGTLDVLLDSVYILALLDQKGRPIWHGKRRRDYPTGQADDNFGETTPTKHALLDIDGDGRFEIASAGYQDGARVIDPSDGRVLWSLAAPGPSVHKCCAADIDGKGGDELLYVAGRELIAVTGDRKRGRVLWTWRGPAALSLPAIADTDGDGLAEIVVQSADGWVHCIGGAGH